MTKLLQFHRTFSISNPFSTSTMEIPRNSRQSVVSVIRLQPSLQRELALIILTFFISLTTTLLTGEGEKLWLKLVVACTLKNTWMAMREPWPMHGHKSSFFPRAARQFGGGWLEFNSKSVIRIHSTNPISFACGIKIPYYSTHTEMKVQRRGRRLAKPRSLHARSFR